MKHSHSALAVIVLSGIASAQPVPTPDIPHCAKKCVADAIAASTNCGPDDLWCQCQPNNLKLIVPASTPCVIEKCNDPKGPTPIEVEADAQYKCFLVISHGPPGWSSVSETASPTVSPTRISSTAGSTRETIIVSYSGVPALDCECEEPAKAVSSSTVVNNSTYTPSPTPLKSAGGANYFVVNVGSMLAVGMAVLIAL